MAIGSREMAQREAGLNYVGPRDPFLEQQAGNPFAGGGAPAPAGPTPLGAFGGAPAAAPVSPQPAGWVQQETSANPFASFGGNVLRALPMLLGGPGAFAGALFGQNSAGAVQEMRLNRGNALAEAVRAANGDPRKLLHAVVSSPEAAQIMAHPNFDRQLAELNAQLSGPEPTILSPGQVMLDENRQPIESTRVPFKDPDSVREAIFAMNGDVKKARQLLFDLIQADINGESDMTVSLFSLGQDEQGRDRGQAAAVYNKRPVVGPDGRQTIAPPVIIPLVGDSIPSGDAPGNDRFQRTGEPSMAGFDDPQAGRAMAALGAGLPAQAEAMAGTVMRWFDQDVNVGLAQNAWRHQLFKTRSTLDLLQRGGRESEAAFKRIEPIWVNVGAMTDPRAAIQEMQLFREGVEGYIIKSQGLIDTARSAKARTEATVFYQNMLSLLDTLPSFDEMQYVQDGLASGRLQASLLESVGSVTEGAEEALAPKAMDEKTFDAILTRDLTGDDPVSDAELDQMSDDQINMLTEAAQAQADALQQQTTAGER